MNKEVYALLIWMLVCYLLISFIFLDFNPIAWSWVGRLLLISSWFWGVSYFEKNI